MLKRLPAEKPEKGHIEMKRAIVRRYFAAMETQLDLLDDVIEREGL
jgi:hypothetical protein